VTQQEFRSRELQLELDDAAPQLSQAIAAQFAAVAEHKWLLPKGYFLWELIYPQDEEGMPLYNPHGKYIIKLFIQGRWRQVMIDDIMPVGHAIVGNSPFAPVMPASTNVNVIWPQLLAKGLLVAFQDDLSSPVLPCIQALTGWTPYQLPLSWHAAQALKSVRTFCTMKMNSQVDLEGRNRITDVMQPQEQVDPRARGAKPAAPPPTGAPAAVPALNLSGGSQQPAPKLGSSPTEALMEFLVCEVEDEPRQVRLKAGATLPLHGTPRKLTREVESEDEDASADEAANEDATRQQARQEHDDVDDSDREDLEEDEEDRRSQNSPSGDAANAQSSARSKEGGSQAEGGEGEGEGGEEGQEGEAEEDLTPWVAPWPEDNPAPMMMKSMLQDFQTQCNGGFWVSYEEVEANAASLCSYIPPGDHLLSALLDTRWNAERAEAYKIPPVRILRMNLVPNDVDSRSRPTEDHHTSKKSSLSPWFQTVIAYEPLRISPLFGEVPAQPSPVNCVLQAVNEWRAPKKKRKAKGHGPDQIHFTVGDTPAPFVGSVSQSMMLPPGEHWYLVLDDASSVAGSTLSVNVEAILSKTNKSSVAFYEPDQFFEECGISVVTVGPTNYPIHHGYKVWTKAEVTISAEAGDVSALQLICHVSDVNLWPFLQLSCLRMSTSQDSEEADGRCASWSVASLLKAPLLRGMSIPLTGPAGILPDLKATSAGGVSTKFVLLLDGNIPEDVLAKSAGTFSLQLFMPPPSKSVKDFDEFSSSEEGEDEKDAEKETGGSQDEEAGPLQLQLLNVDHALTWTGECAPNDKDLVICERITVPKRAEGAETGDVTSTLRIQVHGLPQAYLRATLVAQMPPAEDTRPNMPDGSRPEPLVPGGPINPRDYGGRRNWLSRCKVVAETSGLEVISFPHVLLVESSTYLVYVHLDTFRGPNALEGGTWQMDSFGSGPIEVGKDSMEQDLEELVRRSWADPPPQDDAPPREELAKAARERWLARSGYAEEAEETGPTEEQKELDAALQRAREGVHPNVTISSFLHGHAVEEAVLVMEDPYTVAPDRSEPLPPDFPPAPAEDTDGADGAEAAAPALVFPDDPQAAEDTEAAVSIHAFGTLGERKARILDVESSSKRWQTGKADLDAAKERNANEIQELRRWREEQSNTPMVPSFSEQRASIRNALMGRMQKCALLKAAAMDPERTDPEPLKVAITEAEESGAGNWDVELMQTANCKLAVLEGSKSFLELLGTATTKVEAAKAATTQVQEAEPGAENAVELEEAVSFAVEEAETAAGALEAAMKTLKANFKEAAVKSIPVPEEIKSQEPFERADALLLELKALTQGPEEAES